MVGTRRWRLWGLAAGVALGLTDLTLFLLLGIEMRLAGRDATWLVNGALMLNYAGLGYAIGRLVEARARARADAEVIERQLRALEVSQNALLQSEKLAAIGRLAAGVAHEVRNPLGVIRAAAAILQDTLPPNGEGQRACTFIREEIDRLNALITALLTFSRPTEVRLQPVLIDRVIDRALQLAGAAVDGRGIVVQRHTDGSLPPLQADPDLLAQVILGLVTNAAEALGDGGRILIRVSGEARAVCLEVADDGPGVAAGDAEKVFEPFFTTKPSGTGLGLAMAARIVQAHEGRLEVLPGHGAGDRGKGACFAVRLPLCPQARTAA